MTSLTTFRCDGCGQRVLASALWTRTPQVCAALDAGTFTERRVWRGGHTDMCIPLVCSAACAARAPVRTLRQWWLHHEVRRPFRSRTQAIAAWAAWKARHDTLRDSPAQQPQRG